MRIGLVSACYEPVINGVTRMVTQYQQRLTAAGHDVTVFTLGKPQASDREKGVVRSPGLPLGKTGYYFSLGYSDYARRELAGMDILHCHHLFMSLEMAYRYGECPIVYTNHTRYDLYAGVYTPLPQPAADAIMRRIWPQFTDFCDAIVAPSESLRAVLVDFGVRRPIVVIENGIELEPFRSPRTVVDRKRLGLDQGACLAVYVGRLAAEKNLVKLLTQFAEARERAPDLYLLIVGDGPQRPDLEELSVGLGLAEAIHFAGAVPHAEVAGWLAAADFFATASVSEVHALTVIEAMAAGLPVVATKSPGLVDSVSDGESGLLVDGKGSSLAQAMVALAEQPAARMAMGAAAQEASRRFDIERTVSKTLTLYRELARRPPSERDTAHRQRRLEGLLQNWTVVEKLGEVLRPTISAPHEYEP